MQGPTALERLGLAHGKAFTFELAVLDGVEVMVNRTGYTGEEGVELACMAEDAVALWDAVIARGVRPAASAPATRCGSRSVTRCTATTSASQWDAISSGLGWACALDTEFTGVERLREIKERGPEQKLVPFVMTEKAIPRQGMPIEGGGLVTSGSQSPMLEVGIGLGYVPAAQATRGTELVIDVRGRPRKAQVVKKPIYTRSKSWPSRTRKTSSTNAEHDWARIDGDEAVMGITWHAQDALGELVHYEPPDVGSTVAKDGSYGEVESVKAVSDLISPLSGEVLEVNQKVVDAPETVNEDPYGDGWLVRIRLSNPSSATSCSRSPTTRRSSTSSELPLAHRRRPRGDARDDRRRDHRRAVPRHPARRAVRPASSTCRPR